jgi:methylated-DNA-[protein]-cysteine S-methyltransferase
MNQIFYEISPSSFGSFGLVWQATGEGSLVEEILLPSPGITIQDRLQKLYPLAQRNTSQMITRLCQDIQSFLSGRDIVFDFESINLNKCSPFQANVLMAEHGIPRGWVSTYGRIAQYLCKPGGARAVGNALGNNPFPIIIPCHRAVRANGELGGYQGGLKMKRALLELEGIRFFDNGKIDLIRVYY